MDNPSREPMRRRVHRARNALALRLDSLLFVRTRDIGALSLSPRVVFLALAATVGVVMALAGAPSSGRSGVSDAIRGSTSQGGARSPIERQLTEQIGSSVWGTGVQRAQTEYDAKTNAVTVTITLDGTIPHTAVETSTAQELSKGFCLMAQQAIWSGDTRFDEVTVIVRGPMQSEYGEVGTDAYAVAVVRGASGRAIDWARQTPDSAWQIYDSEYLRTSFVAYV